MVAALGLVAAAPGQERPSVARIFLHWPLLWSEVGSREVGLPEVSSREVGLPEVGSLEVGLPEVGSLKMLSDKPLRG